MASNLPWSMMTHRLRCGPDSESRSSDLVDRIAAVMRGSACTVRGMFVSSRRDRRVGHYGRAAPEEEDSGRNGRLLEVVVRVAPQCGAVDAHRAGEIVADEEDGPTQLVGVVVL